MPNTWNNDVIGNRGGSDLTASRKGREEDKGLAFFAQQNYQHSTGGLSGTMNLKNTIAADNFDTPGNAGPGTNYPDLGGNITGAAYNLIDNLAGGSGTVGTGSDIVSTTPGLGPLADNGGPSTGSGQPAFTHALLAGSPAIDAIPVVSCPVSSDQRGVARPQRNACDIGAYEAEGRVYLPTVMRNNLPARDLGFMDSDFGSGFGAAPS